MYKLEAGWVWVGGMGRGLWVGTWGGWGVMKTVLICKVGSCVDRERRERVVVEIIGS